MVASGSHLDSVPNGGAYDGALGVASAFAAIDRLREQDVRPQRSLAVVSFVEEEGARFGTACIGSRLLTGSLTPDAAPRLRDRTGVSFADAMLQAGFAPDSLGDDRDRLSRIVAFVEVRIEQGRFLVDREGAVGVASAIWPHGRYRFDFVGEANRISSSASAPVAPKPRSLSHFQQKATSPRWRRLGVKQPIPSRTD